MEKCHVKNGIMVCTCGECEAEKYPLPKDFSEAQIITLSPMNDCGWLRTEIEQGMKRGFEFTFDCKQMCFIGKKF